MVAGDVGLVIDRELPLLSFQVRRLPHQVDELLHPDFREIGASRRLLTRSEMLSALAGELSDGSDAIEAMRWLLRLWAVTSHRSLTFRTVGDDGPGAARCGGDQPAHGGCFTIRAPAWGHRPSWHVLALVRDWFRS